MKKVTGGILKAGSFGRVGEDNLILCDYPIDENNRLDIKISDEMTKLYDEKSSKIKDTLIEALSK